MTLIPSHPPVYDVHKKKLISSIEFMDASGEQEIMVPADNPHVFTIGESSQSSSKGPTLDMRRKPDVVLATSEAAFTDGVKTAETSNAAAYFAGIVAVLKAEASGLKPEHLTRYISQLSSQTAVRPATSKRTAITQCRPATSWEGSRPSCRGSR